ncbi:MAG: DUF2240 family protein [Thermoplasmata archaeon]|uniref:DUF2240 family protein n=1 Tax=Candidatus Sysuiplasma superficiale TaxID=2823368 RepID=A0A8J7YU29_9ARCH|nr:DUF2240 family protein [Candidatus Sysuiplasma superficiale]MBX8644117.1 DUF2240 family protein [Candidatus Sysuiplasma superficiale]MCL4346482.1 DUF2240 family protein [Candidatus Thermoplasmatota archaeon]
MSESTKLIEAVAAIYRRKGKKTLTEEEIKFTASMELRWFSPDRANTFFRNAMRKGLLVAKDGRYAPSFDVNSRAIRQTIRPDESVADEPEDVVSEIADLISLKLGLGRTEAMSRINRIRKEMDVETPAAAVMAGLREGIDMTEYAKIALDDMVKTYAEKRREGK